MRQPFLIARNRHKRGGKLIENWYNGIRLTVMKDPVYDPGGILNAEFICHGRNTVMRKHLRLILLGTLVMSLLFSACGKKTEEVTEPAATSAAETAAPEESETPEIKEETSEAEAETSEAEIPEETEASEEETSEAETEAVKADLIEAPSISAEEFPVTDGSTATLPLSWMLYRLCTGEDQQKAEEAMRFTKTNNAYLRLMDGEADLVIAYEPGPNAKADERYGDIEMKPIGLDALIFICNTLNPVESLSSEEIRDIYSGKITNWKDVGGEDSEIIAFQREVNSGSQTLMENLMMKDLEMAPAPIELRPSEMGDLIESVARYANTGNAFGYSVYFYAKNMYAKPNLRFMAVDGVMPSNDTIRSGEYAYTNPFYAAVRKDEPHDSKAYELFEWLTTDDGQSLVEAMDYVSIEKGTKELPEELTGKTSLLSSALEGNTHRIAVNGSTYDGNAGVVFLDTDGSFLARNDEIRIRDDEAYALVRGKVFPASLPAYASNKNSPWPHSEVSEEDYNQNIPVGLYDVEQGKWAVEPVYDYCYTETEDGDHVIYYLGNWWYQSSYDELGNYIYSEDPEASMNLYDENGELLETKTFAGWDGFEALISNTLLRKHRDYTYYEDTGETVYNLGGKARFIDSYVDGESSAILEIGGKVVASGTSGYVRPAMSDFISEDTIAPGWAVVHIYSSGSDENGEWYYHNVGQYVINDKGELVYTLHLSDAENTELVDKHFLIIGNYDSGKHRLLDYEGNEAASWITPEDYEYVE